MSRTILRWLALGCTVIPLSAGLAHAFELYNKMMLDGPLWLAVQQHLYRGWGPLIAPFEGDDKLYNKMDGLILRNTMFGNQFDLTAISLPVPGTALPVGLMLVARHGHDRRLLEIAAGVEALLARGA